MRHLFHTRAEVLRSSVDIIDGVPDLTWGKVNEVVDAKLGVPGELMCRIDLNFVRQGKDLPPPLVAGRAPDRVGVMYFDVTDKVKAGYRIRCLSGPVTGTFELRAIPDPAIGYSRAHHMEVQVIEVAQALLNVYPGADVAVEETP